MNSTKWQQSENRIKVSTFIQLNPKPPSSFHSAATVAHFTIMLHFLTKLLEQGVGHAFLFSQESLKKVREKQQSLSLSIAFYTVVVPTTTTTTPTTT